MSQQSLQPLFKRPISHENIDVPFDGDSFEREALAARLTGYFDRAPDGIVIAIDSPWGEGKTWFGRHWHASLLKQGGYENRAIYIDCFQRDHIEDPFTVIAGELLSLAKSGIPKARQKFLEASKRLSLTLVPAATKFAVKAAGHWAIGNSNLGRDVTQILESIDESAAAGLEKMVAKRLDDYEKDKRTVDSFRVALSELASAGDKPIVIFLDELDRCRPDFAVRTIERIKHFFDVPKVVFVLLLNRRQLTAAIEGLYGSRLDAEAYLGKFINLMLTLPKRRILTNTSSDDNHTHCVNTLKRHGFTVDESVNNFAEQLGWFATFFNLSLRDIERGVTLFALAQPVERDVVFLSWPIALKLSKPELFGSLMNNEPSAHQEAASLLGHFISATTRETECVQYVRSMHVLGSRGFQGPLEEDHKTYWGGHGITEARRFFVNLFNRVDLIKLSFFR